MANRLSLETSPYLLQHADNPVDWHPWGEEALSLSKAQNKPILLSIGYSACHWCHVMAHESFEDVRTAEIMNALFINIKVDREERPDIDQIYQTAHAMMTQRSGGWPLTMFLTPEQIPFYGGTYFPPTQRYNLPGFADLLPRVAAAYHERGASIQEQTQPLLDALAQRNGVDAAVDLNVSMIANGIAHLKSSFDSRHGGLGSAPKFPNEPDWALFLYLAREDDDARAMVVKTLSAMAAGGIYDHLAGGFCRYSVDERWDIPHFEKMLYDNGQLLSLYADGWLLTGEPRWKGVVEESIHWLLDELQDVEGAFYAALDADSEGVEGKFYVWERSEIQTLLLPEIFPTFAEYYGLDAAPNFEDEYWNLRVTGIDDGAPQLAVARKLLLDARAKRIRPGLDDKILTSWNALAIKGLAQSAQAFQRHDWLERAQQAMDFIRQNLWQDGQLHATYKQGRARFNGYLDDHAFLLDALLMLLQAEYRQQDLEFAVML
ncbi:MAG TPA: thioredoxin domain-containing protein, partial [Methylophilaceae bacterium]